MDEVEKTLVLPLAAKAAESRRAHPILLDERAEMILSSLALSPDELKIPKKSELMMLMRAKRFDLFGSSVLEQHPGAVVLHLGCGLDSRKERIGTSSCRWYDVDLPEVMRFRRTFFEMEEGYTMISSSVSDLSFLDDIDLESSHVLCMAEGLLMYLSEQEVRSLVCEIARRAGSLDLICDVFSKLTAKHIGSHPSLRNVKDHHFWGVDDPDEISS
jgi:O-methyltransferase involved in polyketide biosynthesis